AMRGSNDDLRGMIDRGEVGQFAQLWGMYEQASATTAAQAGQYAYGAESAAASRELALAVAELRAVQRSLTVSNGVQATIATQTAANVAATNDVRAAVGELTAAQRAAAAGGVAQSRAYAASH